MTTDLIQNFSITILTVAVAFNTIAIVNLARRKK